MKRPTLVLILTMTMAIGFVADARTVQRKTKKVVKARTSPIGLGVVKRDQTASSGKCLLNTINSQGDAAEVLNDYNVKPVDARPEERVALANALYQISALFGGVFKPMANCKVSFATRHGASRYAGFKKGQHQIQMARCSSDGGCRSNTSAHMLHEMGHQLGNSAYPGGGNYYSRFRRVAGSCKVSRYARTNGNEGFAEAFAAYMTHPELLSEGSAACKKAYGFFAEQVFKANGNLSTCQEGRKRQLLNKLLSGPGRWLHGIALKIRSSESMDPPHTEVRAGQ